MIFHPVIRSPDGQEGRTDGPTDGRMDGPTDGRIDGPTDGRTDLRTDTTSYRVASTRLKMVIDLQSEPKVHKLFHGLFVAKWLFFTVTYLRSLNSCTLNIFAGVKRTSEYNGI